MTDFKAILRLCQAGADLASSGEWHGVATANDAQYPNTGLRETHCSYNVRADRRVSSSKFIFS